MLEVLLDVLENLSDDSASLEEAKEDESEGLFDKVHEVFDNRLVMLTHLTA